MRVREQHLLPLQGPSLPPLPSESGHEMALARTPPNSHFGRYCLTTQHSTPAVRFSYFGEEGNFAQLPRLPAVCQLLSAAGG